MILTVLGGQGAWPTPTAGCSGYLIQHDGYNLLVDPGYATVPALLSLLPANQVDAVLISHGHPDHCADLNPLLRARSLADSPAEVIPIYAPPNALDAVLALDPVRSVRAAGQLHDIDDGADFALGPLRITARRLPHHVPNLGFRISAVGHSIVYTGDAGPSEVLVELAENADVLLAEATYPEVVPGTDAPFLSSARQVARQAVRARVGRTLLTHLWPGSSSAAAVDAAQQEAALQGATIDVEVATPGLRIELG